MVGFTAQQTLHQIGPGAAARPSRVSGPWVWDGHGTLSDLCVCLPTELSDLQQPQLPERGDGGLRPAQPLHPSRQQHQVLDRLALGLGLQPGGQDPRRDPGP